MILNKRHHLKSSRDGFKLYETVDNKITGEVFTRLLCTIHPTDMSIMLSYYTKAAGRKCNHAWSPTNLKMCVHCGHMEEMKPLIPRMEDENK